MKYRILSVLAILLLAVTITAQDNSYPQPEALVPEVLNVYPHDEQAFTQGLIWLDGSLYESTGQRGESTLREVNPQTGEVIRSVDVRRPIEELTGANPKPEYFAEGLELVNGQLIQLTWLAGEAFVYDLDTFEKLDTYTYEGQGWGLCTDERYLYMSDSSQYLSIREMDTFELIGRMLVTVGGQPLNANLLNELECVGDVIYANLWQTDFIVQIDKFNGEVLAVIDAADLLTAEERATLGSGAVLNGIAYNPESDTFFITGKDWSWMFEVQFVPQAAPDDE